MDWFIDRLLIPLICLDIVFGVIAVVLFCLSIYQMLAGVQVIPGLR